LQGASGEGKNRTPQFFKAGPRAGRLSLGIAASDPVQRVLKVELKSGFSGRVSKDNSQLDAGVVRLGRCRHFYFGRVAKLPASLPVTPQFTGLWHHKGARRVSRLYLLNFDIPYRLFHPTRGIFG